MILFNKMKWCLIVVKKALRYLTSPQYETSSRTWVETLSRSKQVSQDHLIEGAVSDTNDAIESLTRASDYYQNPNTVDELNEELQDAQKALIRADERIRQIRKSLKSHQRRDGEQP